MTDDELTNLSDYFCFLPSSGFLYATRNGIHVDYKIQDLKRDWNRLLPANSAYRTLARSRYKTLRQALLEFHGSSSRNNRLVDALAVKLYGRVTAYTQENVQRHILGAAVAKKWAMFFSKRAMFPL